MEKLNLDNELLKPIKERLEKTIDIQSRMLADALDIEELLDS